MTDKEKIQLVQFDATMSREEIARNLLSKPLLRGGVALVAFAAFHRLNFGSSLAPCWRIFEIRFLFRGVQTPKHDVAMRETAKFANGLPMVQCRLKRTLLILSLIHI